MADRKRKALPTLWVPVCGDCGEFIWRAEIATTKDGALKCGWRCCGGAPIEPVPYVPKESRACR